MRRRSRRAQSGVALLAAVLVVALAVVLVAGLLDRGESARARTRNLLRAEQSWQLMQGVELWAQQALRKDLESSEGFDARGEGWSLPMPPIAVPGGQLTGTLRDANGCFNLNSLMQGDAPAPQALARFERLVANLRLDPSIVDAVRDWIDSDSAPASHGAEDIHYQARSPAYRAANRPMAHVSELRLLAGIDAKAYDALRPHVCALPGDAPINLNFASPQLWMSIDSRITEAMARQLWRDGQARYRNITEVRDALDALLGPGQWVTTGLDTRSEWFVLEAELVADGLPFVYSSVLQRDERGVFTRARIRGRW